MKRELLGGPIVAVVSGGVHGGVAGRLAAMLSVALIAGLLPGCGRETLPGPIVRHDLGGTWMLTLDPEAEGLDAGWAALLESGATPGPTFPVPVPGPLEGTPQTALYQLESASGYDGVVWYRRRLVAPPGLDGATVRLRFERVNYAARVWLDGEFVGQHEGGYEPFELDVTGRLTSSTDHGLVVMVVDPGATEVLGLTLRTTPHGKESWYHNWGGLLGDVTLEVQTAVDCGSLRVEAEAATGQIHVTAALRAPPASLASSARLAVAVDGAIEEELDVRLVDGRGVGEVTVTLSSPELWSPDDPRLFDVQLFVDDRPVARRLTGFRTVAMRDGDILINGERKPLFGALYQPHFTGTGGLPPDAEECEAIVAAMLDTGLDFVRVHVQPAPVAFLDACDRLGLMVVAEPAIGWVEDDPELLGRMQAEIEWMVERDRHHPSIIMWGVLNELSGKAYRYAETLALGLAALDPSRPVLEDSGGFRGGRYVAPGADVLSPMRDEHVYPAYPLPPAERATLSTLGAGEAGPVFVSEFGYGTVLDADAALAGFVERNLHGEERAFFTAVVQTAQRARESGELWADHNWRDEAAAVQAQAVTDMVELLRANPAVDLLCYTQWQAVSRESSAGLIDPWGTDRPARAALRRALRPLMVTLVPHRPSVAQGADVQLDVTVVNDTGAARAGELQLAAVSLEGELASTSVPARGFEPGVTRLTATLAGADLPAGGVGLTARLLDAGRLLDEATPRPVAIRPAPVAGRAGPRVWVVGGDADAQDFLRRRSLPLVTSPDEPFDVALVVHPERMTTDVALDERLAAWHFVRAGGEALVLAEDPTASYRQRIVGSRRGVQTLAALPTAVLLRGASGHWMGVFQLVNSLDGGDEWWPRTDDVPDGVVRMLGRGDEVVAPAAMVDGSPPAGGAASMATLGHMGRRLGCPVVSVPFGAGHLRLVGVPLLEPVDGEPDIRRDALLDGLLSQAWEGRAGAAPIEPWTPLPPALATTVQTALERLSEVAAAGDRFSRVAGRAQRPSGVAQATAVALEAKNAALARLLDGDVSAGASELEQLAEALWSDDWQSWLDAEEEVLAGLEALVAGPTGTADLMAAQPVAESWAQAIRLRFAGDTAGAHALLDQARRQLRGDR